MTRMGTTLTGSLLGSVLLFLGTAQGDAIRMGDDMLDGVYVSVKGNEYQVLVPETGETITALTSRKDVKLVSTSPPAERDKLHAEWERQRAIRQGITRPAPTTRAPVPAAAVVNTTSAAEPKRLTSSGLRQSKATEELAEFETQLILWAQLPQDLRQLMMENVAHQAHTTLEVSATKLETLGEVQREASSQLAEESAALAETRAKANAEMAKNKARQQAVRIEAESKIASAERNDDSGYYAMRRDAHANQAGFNRYVGRSGRINDFFADSYEYSRQREVAYRDNAIGRAASQYNQRASALTAEEKAIKQQYKAEASAANARMAELEDEAQRARTDRTVLSMNAENAVFHAERQLGLMYALEDAMAANYSLSMPFRQVAELSVGATEAEKEIDLKIRNKVWRVLWCANGPAQGSKLFSVSVLDKATGKPAGYSTDEVNVLRRFLLLEGPGEFTLRVSGADDSAVLVVVDEVDYAAP